MDTQSLSKIELRVLGLSSNNRSEAYVLVLSEKRGIRRLPIVIGLPEAQSIAVRLEKIQSPRPLTHDLFFSLAMSCDIDVLEVLIYDLRDGIFYSKLICDHQGTTIEVDARTSDAVAIALRFDAPIYTYDHVLQRAGIVVQVQVTRIVGRQAGHAATTVDELEEQMRIAIAAEDYERASELRDVIQRMKQK